MLKFLHQLFCFHNWTPWVTVQQGRVMDVFGAKQVSTYTMQSKYCPKCARVKEEYFED